MTVLYQNYKVESEDVFFIFTFDSEDEAALVFGVGLDVRDEGSHAPVEHGAVGQTHGLHFGQHVDDITDIRHLLERTLKKGRDIILNG